MMFNLGWTRLSTFKKFLGHLDKCEFQLSANEMKDSLWSTQVGARADRLIKRMNGDER